MTKVTCGLSGRKICVEICEDVVVVNMSVGRLDRCSHGEEVINLFTVSLIVLNLKFFIIVSVFSTYDIRFETRFLDFS